jgi:hypothetical protein
MGEVRVPGCHWGEHMTLHDDRLACDRRGFLRNSVAGAAAFGLAATTRLSAAPTSPNEKVRLGLIGLGWKGGQHLTDLISRDDCEVVALCDPEGEFLDAARASPQMVAHCNTVHSSLP